MYTLLKFHCQRSGRVKMKFSLCM